LTRARPCSAESEGLDAANLVADGGVRLAKVDRALQVQPEGPGVAELLREVWCHLGAQRAALA
jgi:hypothetical protein